MQGSTRILCSGSDLLHTHLALAGTHFYHLYFCYHYAAKCKPEDQLFTESQHELFPKASSLHNLNGAAPAEGCLGLDESR